MPDRVKLLVLRPGEIGLDLSNNLNELSTSIKSQHAPTLSIEPLSFSLSEKSYYAVIFISPTAVIACKDCIATINNQGRLIFAVGAGTANKLKAYGVKNVLIPQTFNSEGLLAMTELAQVHNKAILIVKGEGGRELLLDTLADRGAQCDTLNVYRRKPLAIQAETWDWYWQGDDVKGITVASVETLSAFDSYRRKDQLTVPEFILVASDRIAEVAESLGYTDVITVGGAANHFFVTAMEKHLQAHD